VLTRQLQKLENKLIFQSD